MTGFSQGQVTIHLTNSYGAQYQGPLTVPSTMTLGELFDQETNGGDPELFLIRHNAVRDPSATTVLREGDRVSITPVAIKAAA